MDLSEKDRYPSNHVSTNYSIYDQFTSDYLDNQSGHELDKQLKMKILSEDENYKHFDATLEIVIVTIFSLMIVFGTLGNGLVCLVVVRNSHMRTPRNIFIINLAISDLTLCLFTQPLNLYRLLNNHWRLGAFMCQFSAMLQGTNVFVSTISITAIALDRFQVIVYPTKDSMKKIGGAAALIIIWVISLLMASPLIIFSVYKSERLFYDIDYYMCKCLEDLTLRAEKGAYSVASMVVQYILPVITVSIAHARICNKLKYRMVTRRSQRCSGDVNTKPPADNRTQSTEDRTARKRKTNILLSMIALVFVFSWMPLNISNILVEFQFQIFRGHGIDINLVFVVCHMLVLSSACTNPVLYGWLNKNFRKEFIKVLKCYCCPGINKKCTCLQQNKRRPALPTINLSQYQNGETGKGNRRTSRRTAAISQMFITTDIDHSCPKKVVSL